MTDKPIFMNRQQQSGFTLVELLIAMTVMAVGLIGIAALFVTAVAVNSKNKIDSTATMLSETVLEQIASSDVSYTGTIPITDCSGNAFTIAHASAASPGNGANIITTAGSTAYGYIDFSQASAAVPANYHMDFVACGTGGRAVTYDVRWNVMDMPAAIPNGAGTWAKLITVGAKQKSSSVALTFPVTVRTVQGSR